MSVFKVSNQGGIVVTRDENNRIVSRSKPQVNSNSFRGLKTQIRALAETKNGNILLQRVFNIAMGNPHRAELDDGTHTEWEVPSIANQLAAATWLVEMSEGKAVPQTEIVKAEVEAEDLQQYRAMSDQALIEYLKPYIEKKEKELAAENKVDDAR